jgi:hypothetical protein
VKTCSIPECGRRVTARGWCKRHYYAWKRNGDPTARRCLPAGATVEDALRAYVDRSTGPDGCWPWTRHRMSPSERWGDYGVTGVEGRTRVAWEAANGPIPSGMSVLHRCDNPPCCNPRHLFLGTVADNVADMVSKGRDRRPLGTRHPNARLTASAISELVDLRRSGWKYTDLARRFGISPTSVHNVLTGKTYRSEDVAS